jgi:hypothetical protein
MNDEFFKGLEVLRQEIAKSKEKYEEENNEWWSALSEKEREDAFYAVISRMYQAEVKENRSYRGALYDVFGFEPGMYAAGMDCGYFYLHNALFDGEELAKMRGVNRFEVIDENGRAYTRHLDVKNVKFVLQDEDNTLKIFINGKSEI